MKPCHGRPYPIPHKHKAILMKEIKRLCNRVLEWQPPLGGHCQPLLCQKRIAQCSLYQILGRLTNCIVRIPCPIPKISIRLQELEGFIYVKTLDLNMGHFTTRLDPAASDMCTIIFPWGNYSYKRLPMGFGGSANIFQAQMMDLMASLEYV
jgi:hypothetical protein